MAMPEDLNGLQAAFEAAQEGLILHRDGVIEAANQQAAEILATPASQLVGMRFDEFTVVEGNQYLQAALDGRLEQAYETHILAGGRRIAVLVRATPSTRHAGVITIWNMSLGRAQGKDRQRRAERDAELARLEQMNQFKTQLLNTAAHELNTPLTPLRLQVHLLASENLGKLSDRQGKAVRVLERNVERLSLLVSDILDVARLESGHLAVTIEPVDLGELVHESAQSYEETSRGVGVQLAVEMDDKMTVRADSRRALQVLYNLVSNGIKFTPEGGKVIIRATARDNAAVIEVRDTGLGMTEEQLGRLFQPFSRVHDTETTAIPGTGLGLYISRGIVEQMGGTLEAHSDGSGKGSTFRFTLPLADRPVPAPIKERQKSPMVAGPLAQRLRELI